MRICLSFAPMLKKSYIVILLLFVLINSCKTDFNIIAPYKQTTVVYGLLDPGSTVQYIKINKAFLGEGNALVMAQQADSINYPPGSLDVSLQLLSNFGQVAQTYQLDTTTLIPKDPGIFSNPYQVLYKSKPGDVSWQYNASYNLVIRNKSDQTTLSSSTLTVGAILDTTDIRPGPSEPINFTGSGGSPKYQVQFIAATNGRLYSLIIRFLFTEINIATHDTTFNKAVDWNQGTVKAQHLNGTEQIIFEFNRADFYTFLESQLTASPTIKRIANAKPLDFIITYAGDDLSTYIDVNQPSIGIIQQKPEYSNITGGIGIFSSRSSLNLYRGMDNDSQDSLINGQYTKSLNFQ